MPAVERTRSCALAVRQGPTRRISEPAPSEERYMGRARRKRRLRFDQTRPVRNSRLLWPSRIMRPMSVDIVFETHSISEDNEHGIATGWLPGALFRVINN